MFLALHQIKLMKLYFITLLSSIIFTSCMITFGENIASHKHENQFKYNDYTFTKLTPEVISNFEKDTVFMFTY